MSMAESDELRLGARVKAGSRPAAHQGHQAQQPGEASLGLTLAEEMSLIEAAALVGGAGCLALTPCAVATLQERFV